MIGAPIKFPGKKSNALVVIIELQMISHIRTAGAGDR
jgi:hypothetical protein